MAEATLLIQDVYNITGIGVVPVGKVVAGTLKVGMQAGVSGKTATVKTIEMHHQSLQEAHEGDSVGLSLADVGKGDVVKGMTLTFTEGPAAQAGSSPKAGAEPIRPKGFLSRLFGR